MQRPCRRLLLSGISFRFRQLRALRPSRKVLPIIQLPCQQWSKPLLIIFAIFSLIKRRLGKMKVELRLQHTSPLLPGQSREIRDLRQVNIFARDQLLTIVIDLLVIIIRRQGTPRLVVDLNRTSLIIIG